MAQFIHFYVMQHVVFILPLTHKCMLNILLNSESVLPGSAYGPSWERNDAPTDSDSGEAAENDYCETNVQEQGVGEADCDLDDPSGAIISSGVIADAHTIYASTNSLYLASTHWKGCYFIRRDSLVSRHPVIPI